MCGILGIVAVKGREPAVNDAQLLAMRDTMTSRGPDSAGAWRSQNAALAHRRLAVVDTTDAGSQPMLAPGRRAAVVYNGELYNEPALREELVAMGVRFKGDSDTETLLHALGAWGTDALVKLRGMFALGYYDVRRSTLLLARDPLGVKPLYAVFGPNEVVFASSVNAILAHPHITPAPDKAMCSAYMTTIRTSLGASTMFQGVVAVEPGAAIEVDLSQRTPRVAHMRHWESPGVGAVCGGEEHAAQEAVRDEVHNSVNAHMRADVPVCALLSGGLDSTITAGIAARYTGGRAGTLRTYCAGAPGGQDADDDMAWAGRVAKTIGTKHAEAVIDETLFLERWPWMVQQIGVPLSTPNEVAIWAVADRLRKDGCVVTISGEGADELFAGYAMAMDSAAGFEASLKAQNRAAGEGAGGFQLQANAWIDPAVKPKLLRNEWWNEAGRDEGLTGLYQVLFQQAAESAGDQGHPLDAHLRFLRRVNLVGLLERLDTATMLAGVEGRTPFADVRVAELAESLPLGVKYHEPEPQRGTDGTAYRTKKTLRRAFADRLPRGVAAREKASFPLPFQAWIAGAAGTIRDSAFLRECFVGDAVDAVAADPQAHWRLAWPMANLAVWGRRWWG